MKIKTGDKIKVLAGKDRGKIGKVLQVFVNEEKVVVEGLNLMIKHQKARRQGEKGQRIQFPAPIAISNVGVVCPKCDRAVRIKYQVATDEKVGKTIKNRSCSRCKEVI